jgi:low temperature requirement protein LtrA
LTDACGPTYRPRMSSAPHLRPQPWRVPMTGRPIDEEHRVATPLELLFDLTFVVAVAQVAAELAHGIAADHVADALLGYLMVFFAIWWAWMNFSWFASAYDTDDVAYRLLTLVQMAGVLVLAAGIHDAFNDQDFVTGTLGYVIMRVAMVAQWWRAARSDPEHRPTALRFVIGVSAVQVGWVLRLLLPHNAGLVAFGLLVLAELAVPLWAERPRMTAWHPHHIAERYGLFTIIVLGECVLATNVALQVVVEDTGWDPDLLLVGGGGLVLLFALWWMYFLKEAGAGLARRRDLGFVWGYGHYVVFGSLAALGAGLEVTVEAVSHQVAAPDGLVALAVAVPVALYLVTVWLLHAPLGEGYRASGPAIGAATVATLAIAALVPLGLPLPWVPLLVAGPPAVLVATHLDRRPVGQPAE